MDFFERLEKNLSESTFCYAKEGGKGFTHMSKCSCSVENPCQAILDSELFREAFKGILHEELPYKRNEIIQRIKPDFKDSQWWKDNVEE